MLEPLGLMLDALRTSAPAEVVTEPVLQRMEEGELVFATHEVFEALLGEAPAPAGGPSRGCRDPVQVRQART